MKVLHTIQEVRTHLNSIDSNESIGLVPTMGALHQGHLSLIEHSNKVCEFTITTIFVNPAQFNKQEDLEKYPRTIEEDLEKLEKAGCDLVFIPEADEIYPGKPELSINLGVISEELEGRFRPGHFNGVGLIISKFFNIIEPNKAFFGQKDLQQYHVIKKLAFELNFPVEIVMVPTEREETGLAMSSRNLRLSETQRLEASLIFQTLQTAKESLLKGRSINSVKSQAHVSFSKSESLTLEYFEVIHTSNFLPIEKVTDKDQTAICTAAEIGGVRLIDNLPLIS